MTNSAERYILLQWLHHAFPQGGLMMTLVFQILLNKQTGALFLSKIDIPDILHSQEAFCYIKRRWLAQKYSPKEKLQQKEKKRRSLCYWCLTNKEET